ncbi:uncharacterized protein [Amphiura filiformis]|uniref:uncharacterized protein n=1 Tax=Amphiura filiformis TaxID=82378 RepID=UPI003B220949
MTETSSEPKTEEELEDLYEEKKRAIGSKIEYLKSCDEYLTQETYDAIDQMTDVFFLLGRDEDYKKICSRIVGSMLEQGFAQLMVKIVKSTGKVAYEVRHQTAMFLSVTMSYFPEGVWQQVAVEFCKSGIIRYLVKELDSYDPYTKDPKQRILITSTLADLNNLTYTPNVIPIYRAANAVNVLMKFAEADDGMTTIHSLCILAQIANEKESERLATSGECIVTMLDIFQKAAQSDNRMYCFVIKIDDENEETFEIALSTQASGINNLASNDANKEAIVQHGGVPVLIAMLRPEYTNAVKKYTIEALWKLSFLESNLDAILTHLTFTDTQALEELKGMRSSPNPRLRDACQGLLHQLGLLDIHEEPPVEQQTQPSASRSPSTTSARPRKPPPSYQETMDAPHIMISYQHDHLQRVIKVRNMLQRKGYNVWMDVDKMSKYFIIIIEG